VNVDHVDATEACLCRVHSVAPHGERVYTVELVRAYPRAALQTRQFFHLALDPYDPAGFWPESRCSPSPHHRQRDKIKFTYSVKGRYTARMEEEIVAGYRRVGQKCPTAVLRQSEPPGGLLAEGRASQPSTASWMTC